MNGSLTSNFAAQDVCYEDFSINFIGKELFYSNQTLRSVQSEFGVQALRHETLDALAGYPTISGRIVVIDQLALDDLLTRPNDYIHNAASGCLAFAYRKEESARHLFEHWDRKKFGDIGYLPMNVAPDVWRAILRLLMHEELYLPSFLADCASFPQATPCASSPPPAPDNPDLHPLYSKLTRREKQVLRLVSQGKSNKLIAAKLGITEHTVKLHMHNVVGKIGVSNRTAAAHFFFEVAPHEAQQISID